MSVSSADTKHTTPQAFLAELAEVVTEIRADAVRRDRERRYAVEAIERLRGIGFWALTTPVEFGGLGFDHEVLVQAILAVSSADGSLGQIPQNHFSTVERLRLLPPSPQRTHFLTAVGAGAFFGNASAEPGERPPGEAETSLRARDGRWTLSGRKVYATGALLADLVHVLTRDERGTPTAVVVQRDTPGVVIHDNWDSFGQRTTASGSVQFDDVTIEPGQILPRLQGTRVTYRHSALNHIVHAAIDVGLAEGAFDQAVALARTVHAGRGANARAFRDDALGVATLGELKITTWLARRGVESAARQLARLTDDSDLAAVLDAFYEVVQAKVVGARAALEVTSKLFDVGGASSTKPALGLDRYWRDARTHTLHDAVRWKPYAVGRWLIDDQAADPWTLAHPLRDLSNIDQIGEE
ncbi:acyl-CoA dehydrogenase [Mycolicibacterium agri]|uniref:Dibenzothiophene monooxygenase n=1 Tax=Mycolicibacterium agri TaxID=36811 RepID=A0A2A7N4G4_MYCAG|nr:acyl-CoA dehydrogenase family protein [Mycolicibacterium agri]PEG38925.1 acyl-CoA dehydrogenase [Mycolicibacterium agri]GFG53217.1 acyl-CoA dehydrogenase [Mycolicibacterium agri]